MKATIEHITPEIATRYLEQNTGNFRRPSRARVMAYAADMKARKWDVNGDAIRFNKRGVLMDGQHRLLACEMSREPFTTLVVRGINETSTIDTGKARTLGEWLKHNGIKNASISAAISKLILQHNAGLWWRNGVSFEEYSNREIIDFALNNDALIQRAIPISKKIAIVPPSLIASVLLLGTRDSMGELQDPQGNKTAMWFAEGLRDGIGLKTTDPVFHFRQKMIFDSKRTVRINSFYRRQLLSKAWNMTALGHDAKRRHMEMKLTGPTAHKLINNIEEATE